MLIRQAKAIRGAIRVPGDKSIAHRALMLGAIAGRGRPVVSGIPDAQDVNSTISCLRALGTFIETMPDGRTLIMPKVFSSTERIDAGNSGTTARLLSGLIAGNPITTTIDGDASLRQRPMQRIADPLQQMGARVTLEDDSHIPITIAGGSLRAIDYTPPVASAQVKSAVLFAGLYADGTTRVTEKIATRDHSERMLTAMGAAITSDNGTVSVTGGDTLEPIEVRVPADISSAAFFMAAAACLTDSEIVLMDTGINPTRTGFMRALERMGATVDVTEVNEAIEPSADIVVRGNGLQGISISAQEVPALIDELPILAVVATQAEGDTIVSGASELRHKESDRITAIVDNLTRMGAAIEALDDGFAVRGRSELHGAELSSYGDHRIAMAMAVAGILASGETKIDGADAAVISYPSFVADLESRLVR